jgi:S-adenosylmethionine:tRNA ribosyltransferase-isomerase
LRPSAKVRPGTRILLEGGIEAVAAERLGEGKHRLTFDRAHVLDWLQEAGIVPLPPYIRRDETRPADAEHYQTVYADKPGAVAAPTAGLHLTPRVFERLAAKGVHTARMTLHVGYGTFKPISADTLEEHSVDAEWFDFPAAAAEQLNAVRAGGARVVAVGTTSARVLETQWRDGTFQPGTGMTDRYIHPPYAFRGVDVLQTNFHLPRSSLLALVCAFAGKEFVLAAYRYARDAGFRFYSYGDVMLIT